MTREIHIDARWDDEARVWIATSEDAPGLVVEASNWRTMIDEVRIILPELLDVGGQSARDVSLTFKAEAHLDLAAG
jgi:hypothetical protein